MAEEYEPVKLIVDNLVLTGAEVDLANDNAVSKAYVDAHISSSISALVDSAPATLDTLKEIATALNNDANLAATLANSISSEANARSLADASLQSKIDALALSTANALIQESVDLRNSIGGVATLVNDEVALRNVQKLAIDGQVSSLYASIEQEGMNRAQAIAQAVGDISETTMSLQSGLASEITNREQAIAQAVSDISETTSSLQSGLSEEVSTRSSQKEQLDSVLGNFQNDIVNLQDDKFNKTGGSLSGEVTLDSYLNFGSNWRVKASANGSKIIFQHKKADGVWRTALPFICSV